MPYVMLLLLLLCGKSSIIWNILLMHLVFVALRKIDCYISFKVLYRIQTIIKLYLGIEGRAGMACIADPDYSVDLIYLRAELLNKLPNYARPQFVRLSSENRVVQTETFKFKKVRLKEEGFNPMKVIDDRLYFNNQRSGKYEILDILVYQSIINHKIRF